MRKSSALLAIIITVCIFSCQTQVPEKVAGPLEGVWELVSAEWMMGDSAVVFPSPELSGKSIKYYSASHFFVSGDIGMVYFLSGTYTVEENNCIEVINLTSTGMNTGDEVEIALVVEDDMLNLESDWFKESWKRLE